MQQINIMDESSIIRNIIRGRYSTFTGDLESGAKIGDSVIIEILENAIWAPTHGLVQTWFFKVFSDKGVESFFKAQQEIYRKTTPPEKFKQEKFDKFVQKTDKVSHIIAVIAKRDPKKRFPVQEDIVAAACALQNIYLSLNANGVDGYLSTGDISYTKEMKEYLGLEEDDACLGFFQLGKAKKGVKIPVRKRIPLEQKMEWIRE